MVKIDCVQGWLTPGCIVNITQRKKHCSCGHETNGLALVAGGTPKFRRVVGGTRIEIM